MNYSDSNIDLLRKVDHELLIQLIANRDRLYDMLSPDGKKCCHEFLSDPRTVYYPASAGKKHHWWIGGLVEHLIEVIRNARAAARPYTVDHLVLEIGCVMHDSGKIDEYNVVLSEEEIQQTFSEGGSVDQGKPKVCMKVTKRGLTSHLPLSIVRWGRCDGLSFRSDGREEHILHLITSHHGFKEWGSPDGPRTIEAVLLHHADALSVVGSEGGFSPYARER